MRCLWTSFDYVTGEDYYPDIVVGGVAEFKLFSYPEGEKKVMKWTMRNVYSVSDRLENIPYPDPTSQVQADPVSVFYVLPDYVYITENDDIKVGVWDEKEKVWNSIDMIDDLQYDKSAKKLDFSTRKLA